MRANGLTLVATQSRKRLVIPVLEGAEMWGDNKWALALGKRAAAAERPDAHGGHHAPRGPRAAHVQYSRRRH